MIAALKYPVGPVEPKGASGYGPKAAPDTVGEPDYAALARGEPGFPTGSHMGPDDSGALTNLPPSVTGATSGMSCEVPCAVGSTDGVICCCVG